MNINLSQARIPFEELKPRHIYTLQARNLRLGVWTGEINGWVGIREKFGDLFLDTCEVPERTAYAKVKIGELPEEISTQPYLATICDECKNTVDFESARDERWQHINKDLNTHKVQPISLNNLKLFEYLQNIEREIFENDC